MEHALWPAQTNLQKLAHKYRPGHPADTPGDIAERAPMSSAGLGRPYHHRYPVSFKAVLFLITLATKIGAECVNLCDREWWSNATLEDLEVQSNIAASLNFRDKYDNTPLHLAANKSTPITIKMLLDSGARLEARNISGRTPLHMAADYGSAESFKALLNAGAKVTVRDDKGEAPLFSAAAWATSASLQYLLNEGADVNTVNVAGKTALHNAAGWGTSHNVSTLLDAGSNVHAKANNDKTSWDYA